MPHDGIPYILPQAVVSPRENLRHISVLFDSGDEGWSAANVEWREQGDDEWVPALAIRWNRSHTGSHKGHPLSRGYPVWFIVPDELKKAVLREVKKLKATSRR